MKEKKRIQKNTAKVKNIKNLITPEVLRNLPVGVSYAPLSNLGTEGNARQNEEHGSDLI